MGIWLLVGGASWVAAIGLFAALLTWSGDAPAGIPSGRDGVTALARSLNASRPVSTEGTYSWTVTKAMSAHRALVVEVDAIHPPDAPRIASHLVNAIGARYDEVLIYVRHHDKARDRVVRRVAWTPERGYLVSAF